MSTGEFGFLVAIGSLVLGVVIAIILYLKDKFGNGNGDERRGHDRN